MYRAHGLRVCVCVSVCLHGFSFHLPCVGGHSPCHHSFQVAAQTDTLHCDDGLLGQDGAAWWGYKSITTNCLSHTYNARLQGAVFGI